MKDFDQFRETILDLFANQGGNLYGGEDITQTRHGLQCAQLAVNEDAPPYLIISALLHDIGHFLHGDFEQAQERGEDRFHENLGSKFLSQWFGPEVTEPIRLHVDSKRYLCATQPEYHDKLSPASKHTLRIQGGPMDDEEVAEFEKNDGYQDAILVRLWDDRGKEQEMKTADLDHFLAYAEKI